MGLYGFDLAEVPLKRFTINTQCCVCLESEMSEMKIWTGVTFGSSSSVHSFLFTMPVPTRAPGQVRLWVSHFKRVL